MKLPALLAAFAATLPLTAWAHDNGLPRYQVNEIEVPPELRTGCLTTQAQRTYPAGINDFGVVAANITCYTQEVPDQAPSITSRQRAFVGALGSGSYALPSSAVQNFAARINNLGQVFGGDNTGVLLGTRWSLSGGVEHVFDEPACEFLNINGASGGNSRYVVGWGLRRDPTLDPPLDTWCLTQHWLIRDRAGTVTIGPRGGSAIDINAHDIVVGESERSAMLMNLRTGETRTLHQGLEGVHSALPMDINDQGLIAGYTTDMVPIADGRVCGRSTAIRWDVQGQETALPHLPGAISSSANSVGYDGQVVGQSGPDLGCGVDTDSQRAVLWDGKRTIDLNRTIPAHLGITLISAASINRRGQIVATGYVNDEPPSVCIYFVPDPETPQGVLKTQACANTRVYVLTPRR